MTPEHFNPTADPREPTEAIYAQPEYAQPDLEVQQVGAFPAALLAHFAQQQEGIVLSFLPSAVPVKKRWRTNGLSADFLADYLTTLLPAEEGAEAVAKRAEVQSAICYIANELLENAMKFSDPTAAQPISIHLQLCAEQLVFLVSNSIDRAGMQRYRLFIEEVMAAEPSEMLLRRLEQSLEESEQSSGLGLVTILHDYPAQLAWQFERSLHHSAIVTVTTAVLLSI